jgi:tetratricopeptide (TPR) repeat protein
MLSLGSLHESLAPSEKDRMNGDTNPIELVNHFLKGQNLEQLGRLEDAMAQYEIAVAAGFDATGPYDRLIALYSHRARHQEVIRVAQAALTHVRTYEDKRDWYRRMEAAARKAASKVPEAIPKPE